MFTDALVEEYERSLTYVETDESINTKPVTIRIPDDDVAFAQAIANYYRTSRSAVLQDLLKAAMQDFFHRLPPDARMSISKQSDEIFKKDFEAAKAASGDSSRFFYGVTSWLGLALMIEKKKQEQGEASE